MNFKKDLSTKNQHLLQEIGYKVENREYSYEEIKQCENNVIDHIFSQSHKNGDVARAITKFDDLVEVLQRNEKKFLV